MARRQIAPGHFVFGAMTNVDALFQFAEDKFLISA